MKTEAASVTTPPAVHPLRRFFKFAAVGGSGVFVNFGVVWFCEAWLLATLPTVDFPIIGPLQTSAFFSLLAGILVSIFSNFVINDAWTWADRTKAHSWLTRCRDFYITNGIAAGLQFAVAWALFRTGAFDVVVMSVDLGPWSTRLASLAAILIATPLNFVVNNVWTVRER
jgi:putative flippase GtrA